MNTEPYNTKLLEEKARLEKELESIGRRNPSNPNDWEPLPQEVGQVADPIDAADLIEGYEENTAILKDLEIRYNHVLAALERIENGTYGICSVSGEPIEEARLHADPAANTCIEHVS